MTKKPLSGIAPIKKAAKAPPYKPSPHGEGGPRQRWIGGFRMQHKCASLSPILPSVFHTIVTLSAPAGHLPLEGKAAIREYPLLKRRRAALVNLSAPLLRHPERSRGIFIALPPYAHMPPHSNDTLVLPFSPFPHPRFTALQERSLHFGRDDVQERRIASHSFSHRLVDPSCAFGAPLL